MLHVMFFEPYPLVCYTFQVRLESYKEGVPHDFSMYGHI